MGQLGNNPMKDKYQRLLFPSLILSLLWGGCGVADQLELSAGKAEKTRQVILSMPELATDLVQTEECRAIATWLQAKTRSMKMQEYWGDNGGFWDQDFSEPLTATTLKKGKLWANTLDEGKLTYVHVYEVYEKKTPVEKQRTFTLSLEDSENLFQKNAEQTQYKPYRTDDQYFLRGQTTLGKFFWIFDPEAPELPAVRYLNFSYHSIVAAIFWMPPENLEETPLDVVCHRVTRMEDAQAGGCYWLDATLPEDQNSNPYCVYF